MVTALGCPEASGASVGPLDPALEVAAERAEPAMRGDADKVSITPPKVIFLW